MKNIVEYKEFRKIKEEQEGDQALQEWLQEEGFETLDELLDDDDFGHFADSAESYTLSVTQFSGEDHKTSCETFNIEAETIGKLRAYYLETIDRGDDPFLHNVISQEWLSLGTLEKDLKVACQNSFVKSKYRVRGLTASEQQEYIKLLDEMILSGNPRPDTNATLRGRYIKLALSNAQSEQITAPALLKTSRSMVGRIKSLLRA